jgi:hypothetical protein
VKDRIQSRSSKLQDQIEQINSFERFTVQSLMGFAGASARDSSGKPTARNERGLAADSPAPMDLALGCVHRGAAPLTSQKFQLANSQKLTLKTDFEL